MLLFSCDNPPVAPALQFDQASKRYGAQTALNALTLSVEPGEIVGFLGPNGAGKSTAIHLAMGFLQLSGGGGTMLGKPFGDAAARARVGYLPDNPAFFSGTAKDAMSLAGALNGMRNPRLRTRTKEMLAAFSIDEPRKDVRKFSRGMQQRAAFAAALVHEPELLILDEPTSALDPMGIIEVRELLHAVRGEGHSVFFSSHQLSEVEEVCDRVAFLRSGKLERIGTLDELTAGGAQVEIMARIPGDVTGFEAQKMSDQRARFLVPRGGQRECIERIWANGGEVLSLTQQRRSLEELFIESQGFESKEAR